VVYADLLNNADTAGEVIRIHWMMFRDGALRASDDRSAAVSGAIRGSTIGGRFGNLPDGIGPDSPIRLGVAAKIAFPMGGLTVSGLRKEINRGTLEVEEIAGKQYTTLANIKRMREKCREAAKVRVSGNARRDGKMDESSRRQSGSSRIQESISPRDALQARLKDDLQSRLKKH
jgi:hypothetical protein